MNQTAAFLATTACHCQRDSESSLEEPAPNQTAAFLAMTACHCQTETESSLEWWRSWPLWHCCDFLLCVQKTKAASRNAAGAPQRVDSLTLLPKVSEMVKQLDPVPQSQVQEMTVEPKATCPVAVAFWRQFCQSKAARQRHASEMVHALGNAAASLHPSRHRLPKHWMGREACVRHQAR